MWKWFDRVKKRFFYNPSNLLRIWIRSHIIACRLTCALERNVIYIFFNFSGSQHFPRFPTNLSCLLSSMGVIRSFLNLKPGEHSILSICFSLLHGALLRLGPVTQPCRAWWWFFPRTIIIILAGPGPGPGWKSYSVSRVIVLFNYIQESGYFLPTSFGWGKSDTPMNSFSKNVPDLWFLYPLDKFIISPFIKQVSGRVMLTTCTLSCLGIEFLCFRIWGIW